MSGNEVVSQGLTEAAVLEQLLGPRDDERTGLRKQDLDLAWERLIAEQEAFQLRRRVLLHGYHSVIKQERQGHGDIWAAVGQVLPGGPIARATVHRWGHPPGIRHEEGVADQEVYD